MRILRFFIFAAIGYVSVSGCQSKQANKSSEHREESFIRQYFSTFNQHQWQALAGFYADSCLMKDPTLGRKAIWQRKSDIANKYSELQSMILDVRDSVLTIYPAQNNTIIVEFVSTGTAPDGKQFHLPICTIFELNEHQKIIKDFTYYDNE